MSVDLAYTANDEYGVGGTYDAGLFSVGAKYNSTEAYGVQLEYPIDDFTLTGQYATGQLLGATTAYLVKGEYALTMAGATDDSEVVLSYMVSDETTFPAQINTIKAELVDYPVTATTLVGVSVSSVETGGLSATTYTGTSETSLTDAVTLTFEIGKVGTAETTYSGKIGISL
jgi:predicted porin